MVSGRVPSFVVRGLPWLAAAILPFSLMIYLAQLYLHYWIFSTTVSLPSYFQWLGLKEIGAAAAVLVGACALAWIRRPNAQWATVLGSSTGILASPLAWLHYLLVLLGWGIVRQMLEAPSANEARRADA